MFCVHMCVYVSQVERRGRLGETAVQARYVVNSRKHSYYTFYCGVSPDSVSVSFAPASHSFSPHFSRLSVSFSLSHIHPHTGPCACVIIDTHTHAYTLLSLPSPDPVFLSLPLLKLPLYCK